MYEYAAVPLRYYFKNYNMYIHIHMYIVQISAALVVKKLRLYTRAPRHEDLSEIYYNIII